MDEEHEQRHRLRATFDATAELYDRTRPTCPSELFDDLTRLAQLESGSDILEIGCGTGQATIPLARRGMSVVALEIGPQLAQLARRQLTRYPRVSVINDSFEDWDPGSDRFDAVVSVNAFHWIDPEVRFSKVAAVLRGSGHLLLAATHWVVPDGAHPFWHEIQDDFEAVGEARVDPSTKHPDRVVDFSEAIAASRLFRNVAARSYVFEVQFSADDYVANLRTQSGLHHLEPSAREEFLRRVHQRIQNHGGHVTATLFSTLNVATR